MDGLDGLDGLTGLDDFDDFRTLVPECFDDTTAEAGRCGDLPSASKRFDVGNIRYDKKSIIYNELVMSNYNYKCSSLNINLATSKTSPSSNLTITSGV